MRKLAQICALLVAASVPLPAAAAAKPPADPFARDNPRSAVTSFLEACHSNDYQRAAQYLDLSEIPARSRPIEGAQLARQLEAILNSDSHFDPVRLSQQPQGNPADTNNPTTEKVTTIQRNGKSFPINLQREQQGAFEVWVFSPQTVSEIPGLTPNTTESAIEARLPRVLVKVTLLDTPIWKWIALFAAAVIVFLIFRLIANLLTTVLRRLENRTGGYVRRWLWLQAILDPAVVFCAVMGFRIIEGFIDPTALARLYIGRFLILVVTASVAWGVVNLIDVFVTRIDRALNTKHRVVSQSLIYLGRRFFKILIVCFAAVTILSNWGYDMTTILAGLGVGGIAVALAAQSTIANVFGGVSVIGDAPVTVGDFGNFGGVIGTVQDIGMRSARIRTLNRTVMSIPNSSFATMNLENYSLRDKILFNPTLQIKRATAKDQIRHAIAGIQDALAKKKMVEVGPTPIRISGLSAASYAIEIFAYVLTPDINEFYKLEAELFLTIDDVLAANNVELA
ncbi:MAG TPA: mechanosensitive ion channel family protein [Bryobacteraceae bacterium]|jgi:MscS family membrane protein|nr:mechanosensitive ion channel family protein [Bryobacteraceae bacterium]